MNQEKPGEGAATPLQRLVAPPIPFGTLAEFYAFLETRPPVFLHRTAQYVVVCMHDDVYLRHSLALGLGLPPVHCSFGKFTVRSERHFENLRVPRAAPNGAVDIRIGRIVTEAEVPRRCAATQQWRRGVVAVACVLLEVPHCARPTAERKFLLLAASSVPGALRCAECAPGTRARSFGAPHPNALCAARHQALRRPHALAGGSRLKSPV